METMDRFYGDPIVGDWFENEDATGRHWYPLQLKKSENEFEWKPLKPEHNYLWPHMNSKPLTYDESM